MNITVFPGLLRGKLCVPYSKSYLQRLMIATALSCIDGNAPAFSAEKFFTEYIKDGSDLQYHDLAEDVIATAESLETICAARFVKYNNTTPLSNATKEKGQRNIDCRESGATLRFLLPLSCVIVNGATFYGKKELSGRPIEPLIYEMQHHGCEVERFNIDRKTSSEASCPICKTDGELRGGDFFLPGDISSQFVTGLMFALPLLEENSRIILTSPLQSSGYVNMTISILEEFGIKVERKILRNASRADDYHYLKKSCCNDIRNVQAEDKTLQRNVPVEAENCDTYVICGQQSYSMPETLLDAEADWSSAAFWLAANALGSEISLTGLEYSSDQRDKMIVDIIERFFNSAYCSSKDIKVDISQVPDLAPIISVLAAFSHAKTTIINSKRLEFKESNRVESIIEMLTSLGGETEADENSIIIYGKGTLRGGIVDSKGDHRIAMAAAIAATNCERPVEILGAECVKKSYPMFFEDYKALGGNFILER